MYAIIGIAILFFSPYPWNSNLMSTVCCVLWNRVCIMHICSMYANICYIDMYINSSDMYIDSRPTPRILRGSESVRA